MTALAIRICHDGTRFRWCLVDRTTNEVLLVCKSYRSAASLL